MISKREIIKLAEERINELNNGNYLVAVDISAKNSIKVKMDNINQGDSIKDCVSVSRNIEHNLDREKEDFELQVSSPGLDQPFVVINQYLKNLGNKVTVTTTNNTVLIGELLEANKKEITLKEIKIKKNTTTKKKEIIENIHQIMMSEIKETKLIISF